MKAKAPEKIYVVDATFPDYVDFDGSPINTKRIDDHDVEYTRTDAFIDKVFEWLSDNLQTIVDVDCPSAHHVESIPALGIITQTEFLRKFKEEIKYLFD